MTGAVNVAIYLTSTYQQEKQIGKKRATAGHEYARLTNPTRGCPRGEPFARLR